jgi:hypothetical protein
VSYSPQPTMRPRVVVGEAAMNWLQRSKQAWKMRGSLVWCLAGLGLEVLGFVLRWYPGFFAGLALLTIYFVLPMSVRCRVCGLRTWASSAALRQSIGDRVAWLWSLESCPVCGDDGRATAESRTDWARSGKMPERPYWSGGRILLAILIALLFVSGGVAVARWRIRGEGLGPKHTGTRSLETPALLTPEFDRLIHSFLLRRLAGATRACGRVVVHGP